MGEDKATIDMDAIAVVFGVHRIRGWAQGTVVTVTYNSDQFQAVAGVDGLGVYIKNKDQTATIAVSLMPNSASNDFLSAFHVEDLLQPGGLVVPLMIKDRRGRTLYSAQSCRLAKLADFAAGGGLDARSWSIITTKLRGFVGGVGPTKEYEAAA